MIQRQGRIAAYKNKLRMDELEEKDRKLEDFKNQKEKVNQQRTQAANEIQRQKEEAIEKMEKILAANKEIEPEMIKQFFPEDEVLYNKVKEMKEKQKEEEENIVRKNAIQDDNNTNGDGDTSDNKNKSVYKSKTGGEREVERKVEAFKTRLQKDLDALIAKEKKNEDERVKKYENETDPDKKQEIEKKNNEERQAATQRMNDAKKDMDDKVEEYNLASSVLKAKEVMKEVAEAKQTAQAELPTSGNDVLTIYVQDHCPKCKGAEQRLQVSGIEHKVVNCTEHMDEAERLNLTETPTIIDPDGTRFVGANAAAEWMKYNQTKN